MLRILKCFSCREGNLDQGDDLIPRSRIHKKQRRDQERQHRGRQQQQTANGGDSSSKDSVIFRKPFRAYVETLRGNIVTASPSLG